KDSWAVGIGLIPLGLAFGLLMVQTGFAWWWTPIFSIVVYAGSMEFLAIPMVLNNTSVAASIITGFMVTFWHMFYGLTFPRHRISYRPRIAYLVDPLIDASYAIVSPMAMDLQLPVPRILSIHVLYQLAWVGSGIIHALARQMMPPNLEGQEF